MKRNREIKKCKRLIQVGLTILLVCYLFLCFRLRLPERTVSQDGGPCGLYYLVNVDGMKGLGHSLLMLTDAQGNGTVLSFNGMQGTLWEALLGGAGVGKLGVGSLDEESVTAFLRTGDLNLDGDQFQDNYDLALYRSITEEEFQAVLDGAIPYLETGEKFEALYALYAASTDPVERAEYEKEMEQMSRNSSLPLYRLYTNNCDHVARLLAGIVDEDLAMYNEKTSRLTPNGNFKAFGRSTENWGVLHIGKTTLWERALGFFMIF